jgi:hypothetical protein
LPILPFRWVASILQLYIAVEKCIDSCNIDVKKKTMQEWKKGQQFFRRGIAIGIAKRRSDRNVAASHRDCGRRATEFARENAMRMRSVAALSALHPVERMPRRIACF